MASKPRIDSIRIRQEVDESPDLSYLGEYGSNDRLGAIDREEENGSLDRREFRYWYPSSNHYPHDPKSWAHVSAKDKAEIRKQYGSLAKADHAYVMQDYRRMETYGHDWSMGGIWAEAQVSYPVELSPFQKSDSTRRLETFRSGGLLGIESDSAAGYIAQVMDEELADLRRHLEAFGVDTSNFEELAQAAIEEASR